MSRTSQPAADTVGQRATRPDEAGSTLIELLVSISLLTVVLGLVTAAVINGQRTATATSLRVTDLAAARVGMDEMSKALRTAVQPALIQSCSAGSASADCAQYAVVSATDSGITFFANLNNNGGGAERVTYTTTPDPGGRTATVTEQVQQPTAAVGSPGDYTYCTPGPTSSAACPFTSRALVRNLAWPSATPVFVYYDANGARLATPLTFTDLGNVDSLDIALSVLSSNSYGVPATGLVNRVELPNANSTIQVTPAPSPAP